MSQNPMADRSMLEEEDDSSEESWQLLEHEIPMVTVIRHSYTTALKLKWNSKRVARLTHILRCTKEELCALCGEFNPARVQHLYDKSNWPMSLKLHFNRWEGFAQTHIMKSISAPNPDDLMIAKILVRQSVGPIERTFKSGYCDYTKNIYP